MAKLILDGDAAGAVRATSDVAKGAEEVKKGFDDAARSANSLTEEAGNFGRELLGHFAALAGPGALIATAVHGMSEYVDRLREAGTLTQDISDFAGLVQLGPDRTKAALGLVAAGVAPESAAGVVRAMEGAPAADVEFIRAAAPTGVFSNLGSMENAARAYEAQFGGSLPALVAQSARAYAGTGLTPEQGIDQLSNLMPLIHSAGLSPEAGQALAGEASRLFGGSGGDQLRAMLTGGIRSGFFEYMPADVRQDPERMLEFIRSQGVSQDFPTRGGWLAASSLARESANVGRRYADIRGATPADAFAMIDAALAEPGIASEVSERADTGSSRVAEMRYGRLLNLEQSVMSQEYEAITRGMRPIAAAPFAVGDWLARNVATNFFSEQGLERMLARQLEGFGSDLTPETRNAIRNELRQQTNHLDAIRRVQTTPQPSGAQE